MTRRLWIGISLAVASLGWSFASCNAPSCGPGTVQAQQKDGTLKCVPADMVAAEIPCDVDAGDVMIVGGKCISATKCDPNTTIDVNGYCVGTGGGSAGCRTPATGKACVQGRILDFKTNAVASGQIHMQLFNALDLLNGNPPLATTDVDASAGYVFQDFTPPQLGIIVIVSGDGMTQVVTGTGGQNIGAGNTYKIDAYTIPKAQADAWGFDYTTGGAYIAKFYADAKPMPTNGTANEKMPVAGVTLTENAAPAGAKYFNDTLTAIDPMLTVTGNSGVAIVAAPIQMGGTFPTFSGQGPASMPITWEMQPGGSRGMTATTPPIVIITRFHPNM